MVFEILESIRRFFLSFKNLEMGNPVRKTEGLPSKIWIVLETLKFVSRFLKWVLRILNPVRKTEGLNLAVEKKLQESG